MTLRRWIGAALVAVVLLIAGVGVGAYVGAHRGPSPRVKDGVTAPHPDCRDDIEDPSHPWIMNGWWAGRVDGQINEMSSQDAMAMALAGHRMERVWLCPPLR
jgi:hypothetical protein